MGNFRITINAVGDHGADRKIGDGETLPENIDPSGGGRVDQIARDTVKALKDKGCSVSKAEIVHWPGSDSEVTDDLVGHVRHGSF
jgi:hypothetical protein